MNENLHHLPSPNLLGKNTSNESSIQLPHRRGKQILELLREYGVLSSSMLRLLLEPTINPRRLRTALARLERKRLVVRKAQDGGGSLYSAFHLNTRPYARKRLLKALQVESNTFFPPDLCHEDLTRAEFRGLWAHRLRKLLPSARIVTRMHYQHDAYAKAVLNFGNCERRMLPDMLLILPPDAPETRPVHITIDTEDYHRGFTWPAPNLRRFAKNPLIDGSLIIGTENNLDYLFERTQSTRWKSARIKTYAPYFCMFSAELLYLKNQSLKLFTEKLETIAIQDWLRLIATASAENRRPSTNQLRSLPGPTFTS